MVQYIDLDTIREYGRRASLYKMFSKMDRKSMKHDGIEGMKHSIAQDDCVKAIQHSGLLFLSETKAEVAKYSTSTH